jgi:hypothetical protein
LSGFHAWNVNPVVVGIKNLTHFNIDELLCGYDLSKLRGGIRGKYTARYKAGTNLVLLSPDVTKHFPDDRSVNSASRRLIRVAKRQPPKRDSSPAKRDRNDSARDLFRGL